MIHSSKQLKDLIRNLSKEVGIEAHVLIRKYMMERFLERVSSSKYNGSFILKGGMLVAAFVGVEARATMDIDTTIKGIPVTIVDMERTITEISNIDLDDNVKFRIKKVSEIMDEAEYSGIRFSMDAVLDGAVIDVGVASEIGVAYHADMPILGLYTDSRQQGADNSQKIAALQEVAESQFSYVNLYTVGLVKLRGEIVSSSDELLEALKAYLKES